MLGWYFTNRNEYGDHRPLLGITLLKSIAAIALNYLLGRCVIRQLFQVFARQRQGMPVYFGNTARAELLHKLHADRAAAIVLTMDHVSSTLHAAKAIRRACPAVPLFARARDEKHALAVKKAGATLVFPETPETSLQLSALVLRTLGMSETSATHIVQSERDRRITRRQK